MSEITKFFGLTKPDFDEKPWHDIINNNFELIDSVMFKLVGIQRLKGFYTPTTAVEVNDIYYDSDTQSFWRARQPHVTGAETVSFTDFRAANPDYWVEIGIRMGLDDDVATSEALNEIEFIFSQVSDLEQQIAVNKNLATTAAASAATSANSALTSANAAATSATAVNNNAVSVAANKATVDTKAAAVATQSTAVATQSAEVATKHAYVVEKADQLAVTAQQIDNIVDQAVIHFFKSLSEFQSDNQLSYVDTLTVFTVAAGMTVDTPHGTYRIVAEDAVNFHYQNTAVPPVKVVEVGPYFTQESRVQDAFDIGVTFPEGTTIFIAGARAVINADGVSYTYIREAAEQVGDVGHFAGPVGSLSSRRRVRDGSLLLKADYPVLYSVIGDTWNTGGEAATEFRLPDAVTNNRFDRASGGTLNLGTYQNDQIKAHSHTYTTHQTVNGGDSFAEGTGQQDQANNRTTESTGGAENRPHAGAYTPWICVE